MSIAMVTPDVAGLRAAAAALREWQADRTPMQLHPGDLGFHWRDGAEGTAADLRLWSRDGRLVAVGLLDAPQLLRMAVAPDLQADVDLVERVVADLVDPRRHILDDGKAVVEARCGPLLTRAVVADDRRGPPRRARPLAQHGREHAVRRGPLPDRLRRTGHGGGGGGRVVGRPGLLEPIGVHRDHRGRGHGRAVTLAAAAALRDLGSSSATVCTPSANLGAVAAYASAGFERLPETRDLRRDG